MSIGQHLIFPHFSIVLHSSIFACFFTLLLSLTYGQTLTPGPILLDLYRGGLVKNKT